MEDKNDNPIIGGNVYLFHFRIFFSDNTRVRIFFFFFVAQSEIFFPEFNIRLYDKNSETYYLFFPPPKSQYFFQQHWESEYFFIKNNITLPPPFKLIGRSLTDGRKQRQPNHNTITYCVYWWKKINQIIMRPHIVFTDGRQKRQPNHNITTYCVNRRKTTTTTQS